MRYITKTLYLEYISCGKNAWLKLHKSELQGMFTLSEFEQSLLVKGNLVEEWARKLFPEGTLVETTGEAAANATKVLMNKETPIIFQSTFIHDGFLVRNDVLEYNPFDRSWNLYEVKGTNSLNEKADGRDHIEDATFQVIVLEAVGIKLGRISIIHLNKEYVRGDKISVKDLLVIYDVSDQVRDRLAETREAMTITKAALLQLDEKALACECLYLGRSAQYTTFRYSHPQVPEYSVHDLSRIGLSKKKLESLVSSGVFDLNDIPEGLELSEIQQNQISVYKSQKPIVDSAAIVTELSALSFPLYFLDYESYPPAIPLFKGFKPYQQVPFQFSIDKLSDSSSEYEHFEYLHDEPSDPSDEIIKQLRKIIGPEGTVVVWHKSFERMINSQLGERNPEFADYLEDLNARIYDLKDVFHKQMYVHPGFKGKTSIKSILPTMVPSLTYKELEIQEGGAATEAWFRMVYGTLPAEEKKEIAENLKKYCGRDTYAMVAIWKKLQQL